MQTAEIVNSIGKGVKAALTTSNLFLGIEGQEFETADIRPEYLTTVKIAEEFIAADNIVSLETHMSMLRQQALGQCLVAGRGTGLTRQVAEARLQKYTFGKNDRQRVDIVVRQGDLQSVPAVLIEAKLGAQNLAGIIEDINRITRLLGMYSDAGLLVHNKIYGAVIFHFMREGEDFASLQARAANIFTAINAHLIDVTQQYANLSYKADFLGSAMIQNPVQGFLETYEDGTEENVFAKDKYVFVPGLAFIGNDKDIRSTQF